MISLAEPDLSGNELKYLSQCVETNFVSSVGPFVAAFEEAFAAFVGSPYAVAVSNGTAALHLALILAGVESGDEVIVSDFTFAASVNPILYLGARPILTDSEITTWNLDPGLVIDELDRRSRLGLPMPKAILVVHILGCPAQLEGILLACQKYGVWLIEDAAEALGATWTEGPLAGRQVGAVGHIGCFSFNGNKIMTTGGGGMLVSSDASLMRRAKHLSTQAKEPGFAYFHTDVGYNYRLTNLSAALGIAQLERMDQFLSSKRAIARRYDEAFASIPEIQRPPAPLGMASTYWLYSILLNCSWEEPLRFLMNRGVQTRPLWTPLHLMPPYRTCTKLGNGSTSEYICSRGLSLPCSTRLSQHDQATVIGAVQSMVMNHAL
jgi:dTDP-4-amino-4,6-dideoxygalactose transaminase